MQKSFSPTSDFCWHSFFKSIGFLPLNAYFSVHTLVLYSRLHRRTCHIFAFSTLTIVKGRSRIKEMLNQIQ